MLKAAALFDIADASALHVPKDGEEIVHVLGRVLPAWTDAHRAAPQRPEPAVHTRRTMQPSSNGDSVLIQRISDVGRHAIAQIEADNAYARGFLGW